MPTLGQTIYERMLAKQAADQAYARDEQRYQQNREDNQWQRGIAEQDQQERSKQAEFDRQFKVAQMLGQSAGLRGEEAPQMRTPVAQEYADASAGQGQYTLSAFLQEQAQKQREQDVKLGISRADLADKQQGREYERDQKADLQNDAQDFEWKLQQMLEQGRNFRDKQAADGKAKDYTGSLRNEFQAQQTYKDMQNVAAAFEKIKNSGETGPGDMGMIYAYMKMLDPQSTVRESEFSAAANSGSLPERVQGWVDRMGTGKRFTPELRQQFLKEAENVFGSQRNRYDATANQYRRLAQGVGANPNDVVLNILGGSQGGASQGAKIKVRDKTGQTFMIDESDLQEALFDGAQVVQ